MASIIPDYSAASTFASAQLPPPGRQTTMQSAQALAASPIASQVNESYSSQAYQMTMSDATAAQANAQTVQAQNHLIEQMNAGFAGDEV